MLTKRYTYFFLLIAIALSSTIGTSANAALFSGESIDYIEFYPDTSTQLFSTTFTVATGSEITNGFLVGMDLDVSDENILITFSQNVTFASATFTGFGLFDDLLSIPTITGFTLASTTVSGFDASRISFGADSLYVNLESLSPQIGQTISIDVEGAVGPPGPATPEPASLAIWGLGALGLAAVGRAQRRKT